MSYDYYEKDENQEYDDNLFISKITSIDKKKLLIILIVIILLIGGMLIGTGLIDTNGIIGPDGRDDISFITEDGVSLKIRGSITTEDGDIETFSTTGEVLDLSANPEDTMRVSISTTGIPLGLSGGTVTVLGANGEIISTTIDEITYDVNGQIVLILNPELDLGLTENLNNYDGTSEEYIFQVTLVDNNRGNEVIFEIPIIIHFVEFVGTGCIALSRSSISETTHYGALELNAKIKVLCTTTDDLLASVDWRSKHMGPVEVLFDKSYSAGTSLVNDFQIIKSTPTIGEYDLKIYFIPSTKYAGQNAKFDIDFKLGNAQQSIKFDVAVENLEQCISVTSDDRIITDESDEANILIDAKNCASKKINIYLCDGDYGCSGGTKEGEINLDNGYFTLAGGKSKTVKVTRGDIAGVYGVTVHASIPGMEKTFVDEKEITVLPTTEYVYPEEFVVSLLESGTRDSVVVKNNLLAEDVQVNVSVCDLYDESLGVDDGESWLYKMYGNYDYYAGDGLYIAGLTASITEMDVAMLSAKNLSYVENVLIKDAYLNTESLDNDADDLFDNSKIAQTATDDLKSAMNEMITTADTDMAGQIASLVGTTGALSTDVTLLASNISTAASAAKIAAKDTTCLGAKTGFESAEKSLSNASKEAFKWKLWAGQAVELIGQLYSLYNQVESMTANDQSIKIDSAISNIEDAMDSLKTTKEKTASALDYATLALNAAAIDSLKTASSDDLDAKEYLELAQNDMGDVKTNLDGSIDSILSAYDSITTALADAPATWELWTQGIAIIIQFITSFELMATTSDTVITGIAGGRAGINSARLAETCTNSSDPCCPPVIEAYIATIEPSLGGAATKTTMAAAGTLKILNEANTVYSAMQLYNSMANNYSDELTGVNEQYSELTDSIYSAQTNAYTNYTDLENAIIAAQKLYTYEKESSAAATYNFDNYIIANFKEKRRMQGLVGSIISTGFVNGAKEGGVYSTSDTIGAVDCENRIDMTLTDYQINLLHDAENITVYNKDIIAEWDFTEPYVYDFFDEQEVAISFSDNGLGKNSYAIVELPIKKHEHAPTTLANGSFGPFNIPDSGVEDITYKYHFKFNMEERKSANPTKSAVCEKGILFGETGEDAGAQTILSWDWNAINSTSIEGKYLDATQLSILIAKKLSVLDNFFKKISISCPDNYAFDVTRSITPTDIELTASPNCYLPLSTKYFEGKPSLYHQLNYVVDSGDWPDGYDPFFDEPIISDAQQFIDVVDFNVNLMLDGYGTNFQDDFTNEYTRTLLKSNAAFTDPNIGAYKYFDNDNIFFYSSKPKAHQKDNDFVLPDAGKYRVRILIYFDGDNPQLFSGGTTKAEVIIDLELIEPISEDFSPLYYTPYDGSVGLKINNNRKDYGSALTSGTDFDIVLKEGIFLTTDQKDALVKLTHTKLKNFTWLNTLASRRAKILDYSYTVESGANLVFSPTTATPILMKINGAQNTIPYLTYQVTKNTDAIATNSNSLFLWTGIDGCNDFYGGPLSELITNTPDYRAGELYGMFFAQPTNPGSVYLKTVAYTPTDNAYGLTALGDGTMITTNTLIPIDGVIQLDGISNMPYNDLPNNAKLNSLLDIFNSVDDGAVCVSQLGDREIYWWPEEYLFEKDNSNGDNMRDQEIAAKSLCIR